MIFKDSLVFKKMKNRKYELTLAKNIEAGDTIRGYDVYTKTYHDIKVLSCFRIQNIKYKVVTNTLEHLFVSPDTFLLTTNTMWCIKDLASWVSFKFIKKDLTVYRGPNTFTPQIKYRELCEPDFFYDLRTDSEVPILVDGFLVYCKCSGTNKYGFQKEIDGDQSATESLDAKQRTLRVSEVS